MVKTCRSVYLGSSAGILTLEYSILGTSVGNSKINLFYSRISHLLRTIWRFCLWQNYLQISKENIRASVHILLPSRLSQRFSSLLLTRNMRRGGRIKREKKQTKENHFPKCAESGHFMLMRGIASGMFQNYQRTYIYSYCYALLTFCLNDVPLPLPKRICELSQVLKNRHQN